MAGAEDGSRILGNRLAEGKTKVVYELQGSSSEVILQSKDRITAGDGTKADVIQGKAAIATATTIAIFELLNKAGVKTHYISKHSETEFVVRRCAMIPIEWVTRRVATGSFLKRHPGVEQGFRFCPPKLETFYKDDANNDPQWSREEVLVRMAKTPIGGKVIGPDEYELMAQTTITVFEILEKAWATLDCTLVDMKIEFGVCADTGEIVLADTIDNDSWRLWPKGDPRLMKDKQVYRNLNTVTKDALADVKERYIWVAERVTLLSADSPCRVVVIMGSAADKAHCHKIRDCCTKLGVEVVLRVVSAHKATERAINILREFEGDAIPTVFIAVAGRSNGLGPVLSGNATWPVINCPPLSADWGAEDVWSSLRLPSGLGCSTVTSPEGAALNAAQILSLTNHMIWSKLRARKLNTWIDLIKADQQMRGEGDQ